MTRSGTPVDINSHTEFDQWLELEGMRFCYRLQERANPDFEPTLFVSGAFQNMDSWAHFARAFSKHSTVILIDPPGMGKSDVLPPHFGADYLADCMKLVLDTHSINRVNIVAASYGTPAAYRFAQLYPESRTELCWPELPRC